MKHGKIRIAVVLILLYNTLAIVMLVMEPEKISKQFVLIGLIISLLIMIAISFIQWQQTRETRRWAKNAALILKTLDRK